jgi:hypothetical protein
MGWTLGIAFTALAIVLAWRWRASREGAGPETAPPSAAAYGIRGSIEITTTCAGDLPDRVRVVATLTDGRAARAEAAVEVILQPAEDIGHGELRSEGNYELEASWTADGPPRHWEPPRVYRADGSDVCEGLKCEGPNRCVNVASRPRRIEVTAVEMEYTLRAACICVPE